MNVTQSYLTKNRCYTSPTKITVKGLMLHSVGAPQPRAGVFINNWNNANAAVSVHGFIEAGGNVYQTLPWNYKAWHCGAGANSTHIGVEMTEPDTITYTGGASFTDRDPEATGAFVRDTYATAVELFARLCQEYGLNPLADGVIISHSEGYRRDVASNHADVEHLWSRFGLTMDGFRRDVKTTMDGGTGSTNEPDENGCPYSFGSGVIGKGDTGTAVRAVQWYLEALGYDIGTYGIDGSFGDATEGAVIKFQANHGLDADGMVGDKTKAALREALAAKNNIVEEDNEMTEVQIRAIVEEVVAAKLQGDGTAVNGSLAPKEYAEAVQAGITDGSRPGGYATRQEVTVIAYRVMDKLLDVPEGGD